MNKTYTKQYQTRRITPLITLKKTFMKQTAVDWLIKEEYQGYNSVINMAKSIEKQQIMEAYLEGCKSVRFGLIAPGRLS